MKVLQFYPPLQTDQAALADGLDSGWLMERRKKKEVPGSS